MGGSCSCRTSVEVIRLPEPNPRFAATLLKSRYKPTTFDYKVFCGALINIVSRLGELRQYRQAESMFFVLYDLEEECSQKVELSNEEMYACLRPEITDRTIDLWLDLVLLEDNRTQLIAYMKENYGVRMILVWYPKGKCYNLTLSWKHATS